MERTEEIRRIVNLLSTFGDHNMSEEELIQVSLAYEKYYKFLGGFFDVKLFLNNLFLLLAGNDLCNVSEIELIFRDLSFLVVTGLIDKHYLSLFIERKKEIKGELEWIEKFKETKNKNRDANQVLKQKLKKYQEELKSLEGTKTQSKKRLFKI